jgi:hypothetical protein
MEHRLFSFITINWRGKPLQSCRTIVQLIAATTTDTGLKLCAELDEIIIRRRQGLRRTMAAIRSFCALQQNRGPEKYDKPADLSQLPHRWIALQFLLQERHVPQWGRANAPRAQTGLEKHLSRCPPIGVLHRT